MVFVDFGPFRAILLTVLGSQSDCTIGEHRGVFRCRSSTLTILADSGLFRALLLNILGSQSYFHD